MFFTRACARSFFVAVSKIAHCKEKTLCSVMLSLRLQFKCFDQQKKTNNNFLLHRVSLIHLKC